jgi:hypothetical protein
LLLVAAVEKDKIAVLLVELAEEQQVVVLQVKVVVVLRPAVELKLLEVLKEYIVVHMELIQERLVKVEMQVAEIMLAVAAAVAGTAVEPELQQAGQMVAAAVQDMFILHQQHQAVHLVVNLHRHIT